MRMQLFEVTIERSTGKAHGHAVAMNELAAAEMVTDHENAVGLNYEQFWLSRVDEALEPDQQKGLDLMLETATSGFASYSKSLGWIVHVAALQKLRLFKVEDTKGQMTFVIAPDIARAMEVYCADTPLPKGKHRMFRVVDAFLDLPPERISNIHALLEFGPVGIVDFDGAAGWGLRMG